MVKTSLPGAALLLVCLTLFRPVNTRADESPLIKNIEVRYVGPAIFSRDKVLSLMSTQPGSRLSPLRIDQDIKRLHAAGEIANARVLSEKTEGGVNLIVVVECQARYGGTQFQGNTQFNSRRLARTIKLSPGQPMDEASLLTSRREIVELYFKSGFPDASASYQIEPPDSRGLSTVVFTIDEKDPGRLRNVSFVGNSHLGGEQLKEVMAQKEKGLQNLFRTGGRTDADSVARDVKAIEMLYKNHGFFDAKVTKVHKIKVDPAQSDLVITIDEGKIYEVSRVAVDGVKAFSLEKDIPRLKTQSGKPFSGEDLEDDMRTIVEYYRSKGYIDVTVTPRFEAPQEMKKDAGKSSKKK